MMLISFKQFKKLLDNPEKYTKEELIKMKKECEDLAQIQIDRWDEEDLKMIAEETTKNPNEKEETYALFRLGNTLKKVHDRLISEGHTIVKGEIKKPKEKKVRK